MRILLPLALFSALSLLSCKKDDGPAEAFIGTYKGTYTSTNGGSGITFENIEAEVTKRSETEIKIEMTPIPNVNIQIDATATSETSLEVQPQEVLSEEVEGEGQLSDGGQRLKLTLTASDGSITRFDGERQ